MSTAQQSVHHDKLADALTASLDAKAGFDKMVEKAEPEFRSVAQLFRQLHEDHNQRLSGLLRRHGLTPDATGSFQGTVNKAVVSTRAFFDQIDADVMDSVRDGEANVCDAYAEAVGASEDPHDRDELQAMHRELKALLARSSHMS